MLQGIARLALRAPRRILAVAALLTVVTAVLGIPVANHLSAGGFQDPGSESARAARVLVEKFQQSDQQLFITVTDPSGADSSAAGTLGADIAGRLAASPNVLGVTSPWTSPPAAAAELISTDRTTGLIIATMAGGENKAQQYADELAKQVVGSVYWEDNCRAAAAAGIAKFYECGPGGVLAGMMKRTAPEAPVTSIAEFAEIPA